MYVNVSKDGKKNLFVRAEQFAVDIFFCSFDTSANVCSMDFEFHPCRAAIFSLTDLEEERIRKK
jgi:hypothetical protein